MRTLLLSVQCCVMDKVLIVVGPSVEITTHLLRLSMFVPACQVVLFLHLCHVKVYHCMDAQFRYSNKTWLFTNARTSKPYTASWLMTGSARKTRIVDEPNIVRPRYCNTWLKEKFSESTSMGYMERRDFVLEFLINSPGDKYQSWLS